MANTKELAIGIESVDGLAGSIRFFRENHEDLWFQMDVRTRSALRDLSEVNDQNPLLHLVIASSRAKAETQTEMELPEATT